MPSTGLKRPKLDSDTSQIQKRGREGAKKSNGLRKRRDEKASAKPHTMQRQRGLSRDKRLKLLMAMREVSLQDSIATDVSSGTSPTNPTTADTVIANGKDSSNTGNWRPSVSCLQGLKHSWEVQSLCTEMELNLVLDEHKSGTSRTGGSVFRESI